MKMSQNLGQNLSDSVLHNLCKKYGKNARESVRKFAGYLPEVYRRKLYRRRGCASIHEYAAKLAGMSQRNVDKILRLSKKLENKPKMKEQLQTGACGWSKLEKAAYIATPETDELWAKRVKEMPQLALEECVRNERNNREKVTLKSHAENLSEIRQPRERFAFEVDKKTAFKLRRLKQKLEKEQGETISFGEVLAKLLDGATTEEKTKKTIQLCPDCIQKRAQEAATNGTVSRAIPKEVERLVYERQNHRCGEEGCNCPAEIIHHKRPWAFCRSHDPDNLVALCKKHEQLAHAMEVPDWEMQTINQRVGAYRRE